MNSSQSVSAEKSKLRQAAAAGLRRGWRGYLWLMKIVLPVSAAVALIDFSGWLYKIDGMLEPVLGLVGFSAAAALPLLVGLLTGIYGALAAMAALPLGPAEKTLIAIFLLISHNLLQEGIVQDRSGLSFWKATVFRLSASIVAVTVVSWILEPSAGGAAGAGNAARPAFFDFAAAWAGSMAVLAAKMLAILLALMVLLEILKAFGGIAVLVRWSSPVIRVLGLKREVGVLWLTAAVFGLSYGAAVIVAEAKTGRFSQPDLEALQVSVGINHAMIEDPLLFMALGISAVWLWLPRLAAALAAVYLLRGLRLAGRLCSQRPIFPS
ncbi:MAG: iron transporter [Desulfobacterales bacterium]